MTAWGRPLQIVLGFCITLSSVTGSPLIADSAGPRPLDMIALTYLLSGYGGVISGRVTETDGITAISGVTITAYQPDGAFVAQGYSWDDGMYWLVVPAGQYVLDAVGPAGSLFHPMTYDNLPGAITASSSLALATPVDVPASQVVGDKNFRLLEQEGIHLISPNGGESWTAGQSVTVWWTSAGLAPDLGVMLLIRRGAGGSGAILSGGSLGAGQLTITVPTWLGDRADYLVEVWAVDDLYTIRASDTADGPISISGSGEIISLDVNTPADQPSTVWAAGSMSDITWTAVGMSGDVAVQILDTQRLIAMPAPNPTPPVESHSLTWAIPANIGNGTHYRILLMPPSMAGAVPFDLSPEFEITGSADRPTVAITQPNGGETWPAGSSQQVCWSCSELGSSVQLLLMRSERVQSGLAFPQAATGCTDVSICPHVGDGEDYKVAAFVNTSNGLLLSDQSDGAFRITDSVPTPWLVITSPLGGENWVNGEPNAITWDTNAGAGYTVTVTLIIEGGTRIGLASVPAQDMQHVWTTCAYREDSSGNRIELSLQAPGCPAIVSTSGPFDRLQGAPVPAVSVVSPNGGESVSVGESLPIQWQTDATEGSSCVDIYKGGSIYQSLGCFPAGQTSCEWYLTADDEPGSDYTVKVRVQRDQCGSFDISDESDAPFAIHRPIISGAVTDALGTPLQGIIVEARRLEPGSMSEAYTQAYAVTNANGEYTLAGAPPGDYRLRAGGELEWGIQPAVQEPASEHWYERVDWTFGYDNAEGLCASRGGYLATLTSQAENDWVWSNVPDPSWCTIGGTDRQTEGTWVWPNGEPFAFTNWAPGQPDNYTHRADLLSLGTPDGQWYDGTDIWRFVCEYDGPSAPDFLANYARLYYPGTPYSSEGTVIELGETDSLTGFDFALPAGSGITGRILTPEGTGFAGAALQAWSTQWGRGDDNSFGATSGPDGTYRIRHLPVGTYYLWMGPRSCPPAPAYIPELYNGHYAGADADLIVITSPQVIAGADFTLEIGGTISGQIRIDSVGAEGFEVWALGSREAGHLSALTDANGEYSVCGLPPDDYIMYTNQYVTLPPDPPYYSPEVYSNKLTFGSADLVQLLPGVHVSGIDFTLDCAGTIQGTVYDEGTNNPLPGANMNLFVWDGANANGIPLCFQTDAFGSYAIHIRPGTYLVSARRPGFLEEYYDRSFTPETATSLTLTTCQDTLSGIDIHLNPAHTISGTVFHNGTLDPIPGASVVALPDPPVPGISSTAITNGTGAFTLEGLPEGAYTLTTCATGYLCKATSATVSGSDVTGMVIELDETPGPDLDGDGDVDQTDFGFFESCASGPAIPDNGSSTCQRADSDEDGDVDMADFAVFQRCWSGENNPANPNCAN